MAGPIKQQNVPPPVNLMAEEHHFTFARWASDNTFAVNWMNRLVHLEVMIGIWNDSTMDDKLINTSNYNLQNHTSCILKIQV